MLWLCLLAALGAWALRAVAWWGIGMVPVIAAAVAASQSPRASAWSAEARPLGLATGSVTLVVLAVAIVLALVLPPERRLMDAPAGIANAVRPIAASAARLRVFDAERWGSWLELAVPEARYFADSRIELIPASAWRDYVAVSLAQSGWQVILDRWQVDALVLSNSDQPSLVAAVVVSAAWRLIYRDADGLVAVRP
jgi:hypothetical protein